LVWPKEKCSKKSGNEILISFGIKSMPGAENTRQALRDTWLNAKYWNWQNAGEIGEKIIIKVCLLSIDTFTLLKKRK